LAWRSRGDRSLIDCRCRDFEAFLLAMVDLRV
jgi:hypothetical protein